MTIARRVVHVRRVPSLWTHHGRRLVPSAALAVAGWGLASACVDAPGGALGLTEDAGSVDTAPPPEPPRIFVQPASIDFGTVRGGVAVTASATWSNQGPTDAVLRFQRSDAVARCTGDRPEPFCLDAPPDLLLASGTSTVVPVRYQPSLAEGELERSDSGLITLDELPARLELRGRVVGQEIDCSPAVLDFGAMSYERCRTLTTRCRSTTGAPVTVVDVDATWGGGRFDVEAFSDLVGETLGTESTEVPVEFCPRGYATQSARVSIETNDEISTVELRGSGAGPHVSAPEVVDLGPCPLGATCDGVFVVENTGFGDLDLRLPGSTGSVFSFSLRPPGSGSVGQYVVDWTFTPQRVGVESRNIAFQTNEPTRPRFEIRFEGTGVDVGTCEYTASPDELSFPSGPIGTRTVRILELRVAGSEPCVFRDARSSREGYRVLFPEEPSIIEPGGHLAIGVRQDVARTGSSEAASLEVRIPNATDPNRLHPLRGGAVRSEARLELDSEPTVIEPPHPIEPGCRTPVMSFRFEAPGSPARILDLVDVQGDRVRLGVVPPFELDRGRETEVRFSVEPPATPGVSASTFSAELFVPHFRGGNSESLWVPVRVETRRGARAHRAYVLGQPDRATVAVILDDGPSMGRFDATEELVGLVDVLLDRGHPFELGVASATGDGALAITDRYETVTNATSPSPDEALRDLGDLPASSGAAEPIRVAVELLDAIDGDWRHPLRGIAAVVLVTDRDDASAMAPAGLVAALGALRRAFVVSGGAAGCAGPAGRAAHPATRLAGLVDDLGDRGHAFEICAPGWGAGVGEALRARLRHGRALAVDRAWRDLEVFVADQPIPPRDDSGQALWRVDDDQLRFTEAGLPPPGSEVRVEFTPPCRPPLP